MADSLDDLPEPDDYHEDYVSERSMNKAPPKPIQATNWKLIGYATILFLVLSLPQLDNMLDSITYIQGSMMMKLGVRALIFLVVFFLIDRYVA